MKIYLLIILQPFQKNTDVISQKQLILNQNFKFGIIQMNIKQFLKTFNFQHSQFFKQEFEQLAESILTNPKLNVTSKFDVEKKNIQPYPYLLNLAHFSKKQRPSKVPIHLQDKVNRLLDILEQSKIISPLSKEQQPKQNTFINPVINLAKF